MTLLVVLVVVFLTDAKPIHTFSATSPVFGITVVDNELYVLCARDDDQIEVFTTINYAPQRRLPVPGLTSSAVVDIAAGQNCVHIADCIRRPQAIHNVSLNGGLSTWKVPVWAYGLSATYDCSGLLITGRGRKNALVVLNGEGRLVHQIELLPDTGIEDPNHSVQLANGNFVVCHCGQSRLCIVDAGGKVIQTDRIADYSYLTYPVHLAVDRQNGYVFVADQLCDRVVMLGPSLQFLRQVIKLAQPQRLYFHQDTRRLYVSHDCYVSVIQM